MKILLTLSILLISINSFAEFQCAGGKEACKKGRELYRLKSITGKTCAGGYEACLAYLQGEYEKMAMEQEIEVEREKLGLNRADDNQCIYSFKDDKGEANFINVCD